MSHAGRFMVVAGLLLGSLHTALGDPNRPFDIRSYGVKAGTGQTCTDTINRTIRACAERGDGTVFVSAEIGLTLSGNRKPASSRPD